MASRDEHPAASSPRNELMRGRKQKASLQPLVYRQEACWAQTAGRAPSLLWNHVQGSKLQLLQSRLLVGMVAHPTSPPLGWRLLPLDFLWWGRVPSLVCGEHWIGLRQHGQAEQWEAEPSSQGAQLGAPDTQTLPDSWFWRGWFSEFLLQFELTNIQLLSRRCQLLLSLFFLVPGCIIFS